MTRIPLGSLALVALCVSCDDRPSMVSPATPGVIDEAPAKPAPELDPDTRYVAVLAPVGAVDVTCKESGDLKAVHVRLGATVAKGDLIAELDLQPIAEDLRAARAGLVGFKATLGQRKVEISAAERDLEIRTEMRDKGIGADKEVYAAEFRLQSAKKSADRAAADVAEKQAQIAKLQRRTREAAIEAPFAGAVARRYQDPGSAVSAGTPLVRLIRVDELWVHFAVPPADIVHLTAGDTVRVEVETLPEPLSATVENLSPEVDPDAHMVFVEARLEVPEALRGRLRGSLPAWVRP